MELARGMFDVGIVTAAEAAMLDFWTGDLGLRLVETIEPTPGVYQHRLDLHGAVLKINGVPQLPAPARRTGFRLLTVATDRVAEPVHVADPDGNLVHLVPAAAAAVPVAMHQAVADEAAFAHFLGHVLALPAAGHQTYAVDGAHLSFAWSPDVHPDRATGPGGYSYLTLQVMDVHSAHAELLARGARELRPPSAAHFATASIVSFIADPDGNRIEISERPDLVAAR